MILNCVRCDRTVKSEFRLSNNNSTLCIECKLDNQDKENQDKIILLKKEKEKLEKEYFECKKELQSAYKYNKDINKWWEDKLEKLKLSQQHTNKTNKFVLPWKKLAKKLFIEKSDFKSEMVETENLLNKLKLEWELIDKNCNKLLETHRKFKEKETENISNKIEVLKQKIVDKNNFFQQVLLNAKFQEEKFPDIKFRLDNDWFDLILFLTDQIIDTTSAFNREEKLIKLSAVIYNWYLATNSEYKNIK